MTNANKKQLQLAFLRGKVAPGVEIDPNHRGRAFAVLVLLGVTLDASEFKLFVEGLCRVLPGAVTRRNGNRATIEDNNIIGGESKAQKTFAWW